MIFSVLTKSLKFFSTNLSLCNSTSVNSIKLPLQSGYVTAIAAPGHAEIDEGASEYFEFNLADDDWTQYAPELLFYPEDGYDYNDASLCEYYNTLIDRDGHTVAEFQEMENAEHLQNEEFSFCTVNSYLINKTGGDMDRKNITIWKRGDEYDIENW